MCAMIPHMRHAVRITLFLLCVLSLAGGISSAGPTPEERAFDVQAYNLERPQLQPGLSEARILRAVSAPIGALAARLYGAPFTYYLIGARDPDAHTYYGPRVYVSRGMVDFADNREELAGVLCHESSHVLHHDGSNSDAQTGQSNRRVRNVIVRAERLTRNHFDWSIERIAMAAGMLFELQYSRAQEEHADLTGAQVCAAAGINPWGIVWMLQKVQDKLDRTSRFSWFSDHPSNQSRIAVLTRYLRRNRQFARWNSNERAAGTALPR